jgi:predicted nucleotidyltransferase
MANPITINYIKEKALPALKKAGVLKSSLFGSFARGEAGPESDVDLLIELPEDKTMLDLIELQDNLEASFGKKVDLVTFRSIHHLLRDRILREQVPIL